MFDWFVIPVAVVLALLVTGSETCSCFDSAAAVAAAAAKTADPMGFVFALVAPPKPDNALDIKALVVLEVVVVEAAAACELLGVAEVAVKEKTCWCFHFHEQ